VEITHPVDQTVIFGTLKHLFDKFGALTSTDTLSLFCSEIRIVGTAVCVFTFFHGSGTSQLSGE
jgi:hypothetical protein